MNKIKDYYVVNFSGGKDSTAMLLKLIENKEQIDEVVWCDTGMEFDELYKHIDKIRKLCNKSNIKFTTLKGEYSFEYLMFDKSVKRKNPKYKEYSGYSWMGSMSRWCTDRLKIRPINKHLAKLKNDYNIIHLIGFAKDEEKRAKRKQFLGNREYQFPLIKWDMTEEDCLQYCYKRGYDFGGLYKYFNRLGCWCCPLQRIRDLRKLYKYFPNYWDKLNEMDKRTFRKFRADYSVEELTEKFKREEDEGKWKKN